MTYEQLKAMLESQHYFNVCQCLRTGKVYALFRYLFRVGLVCDISEQGFEHRYYYESLGDALPAIRDWQARGFEGEPIGFIKRKG